MTLKSNVGCSKHNRNQTLLPFAPCLYSLFLLHRQEGNRKANNVLPLQNDVPNRCDVSVVILIEPKQCCYLLESSCREWTETTCSSEYQAYSHGHESSSFLCQVFLYQFPEKHKNVLHIKVSPKAIFAFPFSSAASNCLRSLTISNRSSSSLSSNSSISCLGLLTCVQQWKNMTFLD